MDVPLTHEGLRLPLRQYARKNIKKRERRFSDTDTPSTSFQLPSESIKFPHNHSGSNPRSADPSDPSSSSSSSSSASTPPNLSEKPPPHICPSSPSLCSILHVFSTPELLTLILTYLPTQDILSLRLVNQTWENVIQTSPQLRHHFFVFPQWQRPAETFQLLNLPLPGLEISRTDPIDRGHRVSVRMTLAAARKIVPNPRPRVRARSIYEGMRGGLGMNKREGRRDAWPRAEGEGEREEEEEKEEEEGEEMRRSSSFSRRFGEGGGAGRRDLRKEDLLVAQPPLVGMQAFVWFGGSSTATTSSSSVGVGETGEDQDEENEKGEDISRACAKLACDAGIKLGFLAETAQSLLSSRQALEEPDQVSVEFRAIVSFCPPTVGAKRRGAVRSVITIC